MIRKLRKKWHRLSKAKIVIIASSILLVFLLINLTKEVLSKKQITDEISDMRKSVLMLTRENEELDSFIEEWEGGNKLEQEARLKLGLKKPGEEVVIIRRDNDDQQYGFIDPNAEIIGRIVKETKPEDTLNIKKWWRYFFNHQ